MLNKEDAKRIDDIAASAMAIKLLGDGRIAELADRILRQATHIYYCNTESEIWKTTAEFYNNLENAESGL